MFPRLLREVGKYIKGGRRDTRGLTLASLISPLDFKVVAAVSYSGAKLSSAPSQFTSRAPQAEYSLLTMSTPFPISFISISMINTYKGQRTYKVSKVQDKAILVTHSTKARSSPRTDDLKVSSVKSRTSDAKVVAKNGRIASRAPDNFILIYVCI